MITLRNLCDAMVFLAGMRIAVVFGLFTRKNMEEA